MSNEFNLATYEYKVISKTPREFGTFYFDIDGNGRNEKIELWKAWAKPVGEKPGETSTVLHLYINDIKIATWTGYGTVGWANVAFLGIGDLNKDDGCRELFIGVESDPSGFDVQVIRYNGIEAAELDFYRESNDKYPAGNAHWSHPQLPLFKFKMGVDGEGTLKIRHINEKKKVIKDEYKETGLWTRKMVKQ